MAKQPAETFGAAFRAALSESGRTVESVAQEAGVSWRTVMRAKAGSEVDLATKVALARVYPKALKGFLADEGIKLA